MNTKQHPEILKAWNERCKILAEGRKRYAEGGRLCAEGHKLCAEGHKLQAEGRKLHAEGRKIFINKVIEVHGNIKIEWKGDSYHLDNGEMYAT